MNDAQSPNRPTALVTGASSGIGRATAVLLAEAGYNLAIVARRRDQLAETADRIAATSPAAQVLALPEDLTDPAAPQRVVQATLERFGRIDAIVNAAGNAPLLPIEQVTPDLWRQTIDANLSAIVLMTAVAWPTLAQQKRGIIVNLSSMSSIDPFPGFAIYAAAKVGVNMFTYCTAGEGEPLGIQAVAIAPGAVETPMLRQNFPESMIARDKTLSPADVAQVIRDCITGQRAFKSGQTIILDSPK